MSPKQTKPVVSRKPAKARAGKGKDTLDGTPLSPAWKRMKKKFKGKSGADWYDVPPMTDPDAYQSDYVSLQRNYETNKQWARTG
jgi:hypothetical protein